MRLPTRFLKVILLAGWITIGALVLTILTPDLWPWSILIGFVYGAIGSFAVRRVGRR